MGALVGLRNTLAKAIPFLSPLPFYLDWSVIGDMIASKKKGFWFVVSLLHGRQSFLCWVAAVLTISNVA